MELSKRLMEIIKFIEEKGTLVDVGTDHGYLPVYVIKNKICDMVIATDISEPSLNKTKKIISDYKIEDKVDCRLGNGLEVINSKECIDTIVIAGMGGILMTEILDWEKEIAQNTKEIILQPMIASKELREYLLENKYEIIDEGLVYDNGKYYEIIKTKFNNSLNNKVYNDIDLEISPILVEKNHNLLNSFIKEKIRYTKEVMEKIGYNSSNNAKIRYNELRDKINGYEEVLYRNESI